MSSRPLPRSLVLFNYDFDRAAFARLAARWPHAHAGFDLFRFPDQARLAWFDPERFVALNALRARATELRVKAYAKLDPWQKMQVARHPERPHFVDQFSAHIPRYTARHRVPAGLTGWAQAHGLRGDTSIEDRARFDNYYIENWSPWLDVKIILKTVGQVLRRQGG